MQYFPQGPLKARRFYPSWLYGCYATDWVTIINIFTSTPFKFSVVENQGRLRPGADTSEGPFLSSILKYLLPDFDNHCTAEARWEFPSPDEKHLTLCPISKNRRLQNFFVGRREVLNCWYGDVGPLKAKAHPVTDTSQGPSFLKTLSTRAFPTFGLSLYTKF